MSVLVRAASKVVCQVSGSTLLLRESRAQASAAQRSASRVMATGGMALESLRKVALAPAAGRAILAALHMLAKLMGGIFEFEEGCSGQVGRLGDCSRAAIYLACGRTIPVSVRRKPRNVMGRLWVGWSFRGSIRWYWSPRSIAKYWSLE